MRTMTRHFLLGAPLLLGLAVAARPAAAQSCSFSVTDLNFGTVENAQVDTTGTLSVTCTRPGILASTIKICPHFGDGTGFSENGNPRHLINGSNEVDFQLYSNAARTTVWGSTVWPYAPRPPKITVNIPLLGSSGSTTATIYGRYFGGQGSAPSGTYTSVFSGVHVSLRYKIDDGASCASDTGGTIASPQPSFTVRATRPVSCTVSATDVNFGTVANLASAIDAQGSLGVNCSSGTAYSVALSNGMNGTGPTNRRMSLGTNRVTYALYRNSARTLAWGAGSGETLGGTGTGSTQNIPVYGRVPVQTTPVSGTYADTVVVTLTY